MKSPIKNLKKILLNDHNFGTSVILKNKENKWSEVSVTWRLTDEEIFFQIWDSITKPNDISIYKCITLQSMYKKLSELINKYELVVVEIEN